MKNKKFSGAVMSGRDLLSEDILLSLSQKAKGYNIPEVKFYKQNGRIVRRKVQRFIPPDTAAAKYHVFRHEWRKV